jgi:hemerythrin-like domain-containing protein
VKRSEALKPLSREHHQVLYMAKLLREQRPEEVVEVFVDFWRGYGVEHFRLEEQVLIPASGLPADHEMVERLMREHREITAMAEAVGPGSPPESLSRLGEALTAHVRFEERELFPLIESRLDDDELAALASKLA